MDKLLRKAWVKPVLFALCLIPLGLLVWRGLSGGLGANPIEACNRFLGDWALRFLLIALAVTPLRQLTGWSGLARWRRMLGLFAFAYVVLHFSSYVGLDQFFDWSAIGREIVKRRYITLGMLAVLLLIPLAVTSTNAMVKRLGAKRWQALHRLVYVIAPLGVAHHWLMVKKDITEPAIHAAILALLLGWRLVARLRHNGIGSTAKAPACSAPQSSSPSL
ncbi:Membrane protein YedZ [Paramagnetospirillum magnetotacticum MS-1]|uniref:Protein-methionine-sulfoxide reductase heme-binding subunit MsrQ n=1 Tax=Paramagnetospirillum magnetotacticum MS-1 TaxID=272627 RepID=A0A0C2UF41_PARME|nr:protein-methionine-sulfoxide reductase heme-binding subunit MsrQ [Paramagnetospirillum magnetotacticum]KIM00093.1 Membrane protein YedZ [Paramagnetospirillum magnetotacticum MS-1]